MRYATVDQVMLLLETRLQLMGASGSFGKTLGAQQIKPELIEQQGSSIEASVDATLDLIYVLPITSVPALEILRGILCKLTVADVIPAHFFASMNPQMGGDAGFGGLLRNEGIKELERYTAGFGVYYSAGATTAIPRTGNQVQQAVPLPGVSLKPTTDVRRTLTPFEAYPVSRQPQRGESDFINWGGVT